MCKPPTVAYALGHKPSALSAAVESRLPASRSKGHPRVAEKVGPGIKRFLVSQAQMQEGWEATRCFWLERQDGSYTDFRLSQLKPLTRSSGSKGLG
ncbi:protein of unknown function (DUF3223), partial [Haematococcus lacustris]